MEPDSDPGRPFLARVWPIGLVCGLVVVALVLFLRGEDPDPDRAAPSPQDTTDVAQPDDAADLRLPDVDRERDPVVEQAAPQQTTEEPAAPPAVASAPEGARLVVRVLDAAGAPVEGVSVEWVIVHPSYGVNEQPIEGRTDSGGYVVPEDASRTLASRFGGDGIPGGWMLSKLGLRCTLPFEAYEPRDAANPTGVVWLESKPADGAVVEVVLPPAGSVRFTWERIARASEPVLEGYWLHIRRSDGKHFPRWRTGFTVPPSANDATTAEHLFAPVGIGWEVYADLSHPDVLGSLGSVRKPGPTRAGETVVLPIERIEEQRDLVELVGVATDVTGTALVEARVRVSLGDPDVRGTPGRNVQTNESGAWSLLVARAALRELVEKDGEVTLSGTVPGSPDSPNSIREKGRGSAALDALDEDTARHDLGPIALVVPPPDGSGPILLASGRVTDVAGTPLRGATVRASVRATTVDGEAVEDPSAWTDLRSERTDREGRYAIHAAVELADQVVQVHASHQDHLRVEPVEVLVGRTDVDFALTRGLAVKLQLELEPWAAIAEVVALQFRGEGRSNSPSLMDFVGHYGQSFSGLLPGRYHLTIHMRSGDWVLHEEDVDVQSDVDLGTIDLRGKLAICHVELLDQHGAPFAERYVRVHDDTTGTEIDRSANVDSGGIVRLVVPREVGGVRLVASDGTSAVLASSAFSTPEPGVEPQRVSAKLGE